MMKKWSFLVLLAILVLAIGPSFAQDKVGIPV